MWDGGSSPARMVARQTEPPKTFTSSATWARTLAASARPSMRIAYTARIPYSAARYDRAMSGQSVLGPQLVAAERGSLVLTDISGYTSYLLGTGLEHGPDVLTDLMGVVVQRRQPVVRVSKLEGDALFAYALDGACGASTLLDTIERAYFAFRSRQRDVAHATSCTCEACRQIPTLDLKFLVHHGSFVRRDVAGNEELTGRDVIVIHRLSKNSAADVLGTKGYVLITEACVDALGLDPEALGMRAHVQSVRALG